MSNRSCCWGLKSWPVLRRAGSSWCSTCWFSLFVSWLNIESSASSISSLTDRQLIDRTEVGAHSSADDCLKTISVGCRAALTSLATATDLKTICSVVFITPCYTQCAQSTHSLCTRSEHVDRRLETATPKILMAETRAVSNKGGGWSTCCRRLWFVKIISTDLQRLSAMLFAWAYVSMLLNSTSRVLLLAGVITRCLYRLRLSTEPVTRGKGPANFQQ